MIIPRLHVNIGIDNRGTLADRLQRFEKYIDLCIRKRVDIICDMSIDFISSKQRNDLLKKSEIPFCKVPIYDYYLRYGKNFNYQIDKDAFLDLLEEEVSISPSFILLHSAFTRQIYNELLSSKRILKMCSRAGGITFKHFSKSNSENPLYEYFDRILDIVSKKNVTVFLGSSTRPGSICDGFDNIFKKEMVVQKELLDLARKKNVGIIIEGVGHCRISELLLWIDYARRLFGNAPLKPLPIATDIGAGIDHIAHAIAAYECIKKDVEYICCMSPAEHLGMPTLTDIEIAIDTMRLIIHIVAIDRDKSASSLDSQISHARSNNVWEEVFENSLNPVLARKKFFELNDKSALSCTMCGDLCPKLLTGT